MKIRLALAITLLANIAGGISFSYAEGKPTRGSGIKPDVLYHNYCSVCHGDRGDGNSRASTSLNPPPRNFLQATNLGREHMVAVIRDGKPGTAMVGWGTQLSKTEIEGVTDYVRDTFMKTALDPRIKKGRQIYENLCLSCHGLRGEGTVQPGMNVPPRNLASPQARTDLSRDQMIDAVKNGKSGTYMLSFKDRLPKKDIEAVVDYVQAVIMVPVSQISGTSAHGGREQDVGKDPSGASKADMSATFPNNLVGNAEKGKKFFLANCAECHGPKGDGQGKRAYFINPKPVSFLTDKSRSRLNRPALFIFISQGKLGTEMPAWNKVLTEQEIADVGEYVFRAYVTPGKPGAKPAK